MGFPRQEYWSGLPFSSSEDLPDPGTKLVSPALQADSLPLSHREAGREEYLHENSNKESGRQESYNLRSQGRGSHYQEEKGSHV